MSFISLCLEALDLLNTMALREEDQGSYQTVMKNERKFERYQHHIKKKKWGQNFFLNVYETFSIKPAISGSLWTLPVQMVTGHKRHQSEKKCYELLIYV